MTFEAYARDWLERQNFSKNIRKTTRQSIDYICRAIGPIEIPDVTEYEVDRIFTDVQLFSRQIDFMERTFRVALKLRTTGSKGAGIITQDFTYIDDIVEGVYRVMQGAPEKKTCEDGLPIPPYAVYNIDGGQPENLLDYISALQEELVSAGVLSSNYDFEGHRALVGMQPGDVPVT